MVRYFFLFSFLFSLNSFAEMGFYKNISDNDVVNSKKSAVYKAYFPFPPLYEIEKEQLLKVNINSLQPKKSDFPGDKGAYVQSILFKRQIENCIKNIDERCFLYTSSVRGSLFFAQDDQTIFTAFHNVEGIVSGQLQKLKVLEGVESFLPMQQQLAYFSQITQDVTKVDPFKVPDLIDLYKNIREQSAPIVIENSYGEIIFGLDSEDNYEAIDFKAELLYSAFGVDMLKSYRDFARIRVSKPLGEVLEIATKETYGEKKYLLGYPKKEDRSFLDKPSSDGESFYFSKGVSLNIFEEEKRTGHSFETTKEEREDTRRKLSYCDCDGTGGFSGGASVNAKGEVFFITAEALPVDQAIVSKDNVLLYGPRMTFVLEELEKQDSLISE